MCLHILLSYDIRPPRACDIHLEALRDDAVAIVPLPCVPCIYTFIRPAVHAFIISRIRLAYPNKTRQSKLHASHYITPASATPRKHQTTAPPNFHTPGRSTIDTRQTSSNLESGINLRHHILARPSSPIPTGLRHDPGDLHLVADVLLVGEDVDVHAFGDVPGYVTMLILDTRPKRVSQNVRLA